MTSQTEQDTTQALNALLDQEREALLKGDLEQLADLLTPKEALVEEIGALENPDRTVIVRLDRKVKRNQMLLDGALEGIRAVSKRISRLQEVKGALETYGADGKKRDIPLNIDNSVERRA